MTVAEIIKLNDTLKDYCDRLGTAIALAPCDNYEVKLTVVQATDIRDLLESYGRLINNAEIKAWGQ